MMKKKTLIIKNYNKFKRIRIIMKFNKKILSKLLKMKN